jgi:hypothetical protein
MDTCSRSIAALARSADGRSALATCNTDAAVAGESDSDIGPNADISNSGAYVQAAIGLSA